MVERMNDRCPCLVPGCKRTTKPGPREWICDRHWQAIPKARRRVMSRIVRQYRRQFGSNGFWQYPPGSDQRRDALVLQHRWERVWRRLKREAIETAFMDPMI
jgi:hypothetical protein